MVAGKGWATLLVARSYALSAEKDAVALEGSGGHSFDEDFPVVVVVGVRV